MKAKITVVFFILIGQLFGQVQDTTKLKIGTEYSIQSKVLNEDRIYYVSLPQSYYESATKYPVLILSDGDYRFQYTTGIVEFLSKQNKIPETIVVGIANTNRTRDLTPTHIEFNNMGGGGAPNFLKFIETELLPEVDKNFRTNTYRVLTGHSLGGLFSGYAYVSNSSFSGFVASDPSFWWDHQYVVNQIKKENIASLKNKRIYISNADNLKRNEGMVTFMRNPQELFYSRLKRFGVPNSNIKLEYFKDENHGTSAYMSWYHGIQFVFKGFLLENIYNKTTEEIKEHYNNLSKRVGVQFLPPDKLIRDIAGYKSQYGNDKKEAVKLLQMNSTNYPTAINKKVLKDALNNN